MGMPRPTRFCCPPRTALQPEKVKSRELLQFPPSLPFVHSRSRKDVMLARFLAHAQATLVRCGDLVAAVRWKRDAAAHVKNPHGIACPSPGKSGIDLQL